MHVAALLALGVRATPRTPPPYLKAAATLPPPSAARIAALVAVPIAWGTYSPAVEFAYALPHTPPPQALSFAFVAVSASSLQLASALAPPEQPLEPADEIPTRRRMTRCGCAPVRSWACGSSSARTSSCSGCS